MKNKIEKKLVFIVAIILFGFLAAAPTTPTGQATRPDFDFVLTTAQDSVNDSNKTIAPPDNGPHELSHRLKPRFLFRIDNNQIVDLPPGQDNNYLNGEDENIGQMGNSCETALTGGYQYGIYGGMVSEYIAGSQDVHWWKGIFPASGGPFTIRAIMVPPLNKDYDIQIFDACGQQPVRTCDAGNGQIENCTANIHEDFYVKVYGYNGQYSWEAPYYLMTYNAGTCNFGMSPGTPRYSSFGCNDTIYIDDTIVENQNNDNFYESFKQELWKPSGGLLFHAPNWPNWSHNLLYPYYYALWDTWFYPGSGGWPENGTYTARAIEVAYCVSSNAINAAQVNSYPVVNCQCQSHAYSACFDNDRWWYDSCQQREDKREDCGENSYSANYCCGNNVCHDYVQRGCTSDHCYVNDPQQQIVTYCGQAGCSNGACNSCTSHDHQGCFPLEPPNDLYWYDSCGQPEEMAFDCRIRCEGNQQYGSCIDGCKGNFNITVKNDQGQVEPNATVSFKRHGENEFQFAGITNAQGKLSFTDLAPLGCNYYYLNTVSQGGADCGTRITWVERENDTDLVMFECPRVNYSDSLWVLPEAPESILVGQSLPISATIRDQTGTPVNQALGGLIRPYNETPLSDWSNSQGLVSFLDPAPPAGSHNFHLIASKIFYNYGEAWKRVTVEPQTVRVFVQNNEGIPVWHAGIYENNQLLGNTNAQGKLDVSVTEPIITLEARNTDDIQCGYRTVRPGEQANFVCDGNPRLQVNVDNNKGWPLANIAIAIDGEFADYTDSFGFTIFSVPSGSHQAQIYYKMDENRPAFMQEQPINIDYNFQTISFVADETIGIPIESLGAGDSNVSEQVIPLLLVAYAAIDVISISLDISDFCSCLDQKTDAPLFNIDSCKNIFENCKASGIDACSDPLRSIGVSAASCPVQYASLAFDIGPGTGGGIIAKLGIGAALGTVVNKLNINKIIDPGIEVFDVIKRRGEETWDIIGKEWNSVTRKIGDSFVDQIKLVDGITELSPATSDLLHSIAKTSDQWKKAAQRAKEGIELRVIPDAPAHANKLSEYAKKSLDQGWEPYSDGIHQLQKGYSRTGIDTKVGELTVENMAVLKKGIPTEWGYEHIFTWPRPDDPRHWTRAQQVVEKFPGFGNNEGILNAMKQVIENGDEFEPNKFRHAFIDNDGLQRYLEVWISESNLGSIQTIIPGGLV